MSIVRVVSVVALLAIAVWLGGLVALGALAAPVVFSIVALPTAADAMTVVFRRFDLVAMTCAALILGSEATRALGGRLGRVDVARVAVCAVAAAAAVVEGTQVSPRIAELHAGGVSRGLGAAGVELAHLHGLAELLGKAQVLLLGLAVALHVAALSRSAQPGSPPPQSL
jgi:putative copper export protein